MPHYVQLLSNTVKLIQRIVKCLSNLMARRYSDSRSLNHAGTWTTGGNRPDGPESQPYGGAFTPTGLLRIGSDAIQSPTATPSRKLQWFASLRMG